MHHKYWCVEKSISQKVHMTMASGTVRDNSTWLPARDLDCQQVIVTQHVIVLCRESAYHVAVLIWRLLMLYSKCPYCRADRLYHVIHSHQHVLTIIAVMMKCRLLIRLELNLTGRQQLTTMCVEIQSVEFRIQGRFSAVVFGGWEKKEIVFEIILSFQLCVHGYLSASRTLLYLKYTCEYKNTSIAFWFYRLLYLRLCSCSD